jgi:transposase-like protein
MAGDVCSLSIALLCLHCWFGLLACGRQAHLTRASAKLSHHHLLKPRPPDDCPTCRRPRGQPALARPSPRPWRELKSQRGAPKRIATDGFACPNRACLYSGVTNPPVQALVGDGTHSNHERIQTFRCQACGTTFTSRRDTPLDRLKTPATRIAEVLSARAEGLSVSAAVRVFGHGEGTIMTWLARAGEHSATLHDRWLGELQLAHLQLDELRTRLRARVRALAVGRGRPDHETCPHAPPG